MVGVPPLIVKLTLQKNLIITKGKVAYGLFGVHKNAESAFPIDFHSNFFPALIG